MTEKSMCSRSTDAKQHEGRDDWIVLFGALVSVAISLASILAH